MRHRHFTGLLVAVVLASCIAPLSSASATAATPRAEFKTVSESFIGSPVSDGERWVAFMPNETTVRVLDTATGASYDTALPIPCAQPAGLMAVGGGQALFDCGSAPDNWYWWGRPLLLDLTTHEWHEPPGVAEALRHMGNDSEMGGISLYRVGSHWIAGAATGYHEYTALFVDWRTGKFADQEDEGTVPDLDATDLNVTLCKPLRRNRNKTFVGAYEYEAPYGLGVQPLRLGRCGTSHDIRLGGSGWQTHDSQLGSGYVTWRQRSAVRVYLPDCGVRFSWPLTDGWSVVHTADSLFLDRSLDGDRQRLDRLPTPSCPPLTRPRVVTVERGSDRRAADLTSARWPQRLQQTHTIAYLPLQHTHARALAVHAGDEVKVAVSVGTTTTRWRIGGGPWQRAVWRGGRWTFCVPASSGPVLTLGIRSITGATARYTVPLR